MSSSELNISAAIAGAGDTVRQDGYHIKSASLKMLELAEKLESVNQERRKLELDNKGTLKAI